MTTTKVAYYIRADICETKECNSGHEKVRTIDMQVELTPKHAKMLMDSIEFIVNSMYYEK